MTLQRIRDLLPAQVRIPADPASVRRQGEEVAPERVGLDAQGLRAIDRALLAVYRSGAYPAVQFCLRKRGQIVLHRSYGHARGNGPRDPRAAAKTLLELDSPICLFSSSKAITAILVHKLAEEGGIELDAPVARYLPAFAQHGKGRVTISDVLSHRAGVPSLDIPRGERRVEMLNDWDAVVDRICAARGVLLRPVAYHAITGGYVLGEVIRRVTGRPIQDYLDAKIRRPLGMTHFTFGLPAEHRGQVALNYSAGLPVRFPVAPLIERALILPFDDVVAASNTEAFMDAVIPAGNLYATAEELSRFFQMLLDGGLWQGQRLLKAETIARAVRPRGRAVPDAMLMIPMRYSEGMMLGGVMSLFGPATRRAYGHLGFMNILGWADPKRQLSGALLVTGKAVLGPHLLPWGALMAQISRHG
ncbi:MAG: serine hydrolase domain-containing protein [Stagnimonas sp.]|nr:serine hydrolase domain-containing protein [Stagnimonas sp.]